MTAAAKSSATAPTAKSGSAEARWRRVLPRLLTGIALLGLLLSLAFVQRAADDAGRRLAAIDGTAPDDPDGRAVASGLIDRDRPAGGTSASAAEEGAAAAAAERDGAAVPPDDALLERVSEALSGVSFGMPLGTPLERAVRASLACAALLTLLLVWLWLDSRRRRERRERFDDGRNRREQAAILQLLDEIAPLASGDLRVRATVSEAMTGALADAFNHAVAELRWLVGTVDRSAVRVSESVQLSRDSARELVSACTVQAREIHRSSNHLGAMSETMSELSAHAAECARMASASVSEAESGGRAIVESVARLSRIRDEAELATRLMQRLAENATAIDERVETIRDVARRTDLLALNTTIRAAASAAAGAHLEEQDADGTQADATGAWGVASGDLSRLSDEVTRLADLLGGAARDIASLSRTIHQDADDTMRAMDQTHRDLVSGLAQTEQASGSLESIESVSRELRELVREMADKTLRQSGVVRQLSANMGVINRITSDTSRDVQSAAEALEELQDLSHELRDGVADFRLPPLPRDAGGAATEAAAARAVTRASMRSSRPPAEPPERVSEQALEHG